MRLTTRSTFRAVVAPVLIFSLLLTSACGPSDLSKLHDSLNKAAKALNAAAKTNRSFYENGMYGTTGSESAVDVRQKAAKAIHDSNEKLIVALNLAKQLTPETFEQGKLQVLQALSEAAAGLKIGNQTVDLVLQSIATLINQAVAIISLFKSSQLQWVLPELKTWQIAEVIA